MNKKIDMKKISRDVIYNHLIIDLFFHGSLKPLFFFFLGSLFNSKSLMKKAIHSDIKKLEDFTVRKREGLEEIEKLLDLVPEGGDEK